jgi:hypothetical protein
MLRSERLNNIQIFRENDHKFTDFLPTVNTIIYDIPTFIYHPKIILKLLKFIKYDPT